MEDLTYTQVGGFLEEATKSPSVFYRRRTLLAMTELAKKSKSHTPHSRARLRNFREMLAREDNNDEIEVTGEALCEILMLAMEAKEAR